ncbi:hypothetical protein [Bacillus sp. CGMCC 1.16541]|uniref:hypothetical protein n=1 Tax=Bacillus sp. CGMCC 1.16541 TaxID=2185143 RepID=UPI000D7319D6|nr:hypothetical protein [Bacillus sp. CGMCC 1.16541]
MNINGRPIPYKIDSKQEEPQSYVQKNNRVIRSQTREVTSTFTIGDIHIGAIEDASVVNFGNNFPTNFRSNKKHNQGFGNIFGSQNDIHDIMSRMQEQDVTEVFNENESKQHPEWLNMLIEEQLKEKDNKKDNM